MSHTIPGDGATGVLPQSVLVLEFSEAMNRAATQAAIELTPATTGSFQWSVDARQLTFTPDSTLSPDTDYTLRLGTGALSRWWHPLDTPYEIRFHTAPLPAVIAALPNGNDTPLDGALAVIFNQPMVAPEALNQPVTLPQLQIEPSAAVQLHWLDQMTLLVRPAHPWRAATHYTATISPDLSDLHGATLGQPFSWHWSTAWPSPLARTSVAATRRVGAHQPLVLTLSAPLDERLLRTALRTDPPAAVEISTAQISTTQVVTLTPQLGWEYDRTYQVWLQTDDPHLTPAPDLAWRFQVEPQPSLIAFFPGQDQSLAAEQEVRLIFSTPMDESALRDGLRIDPPVGELGLRVHETEVRLQPDLQPSQAYTITIAASTRDRSGEPLGISETLRLRAAAGEPTLRAPAARSNVISVPANQTVRILLERINLSQLDLSLYQLDTPTAVRAMGLAADEWASFNPERYGQHLTRSWQLRLNDPRDTPTKSLIPVEINTDEALPTGFYYLRVRAHEGPQADLLLQVSQLHLTLSQNDSQVLVWATDQTNGRPIADVPLMLYAGEVLVAHGQTDAAGVWKQALQRPDAAGQYLVIADGADPALVRGDWQTSPAEPNPPRYHTLLFLSRPSYLPGESVQLSGFVRVQSGDQRLALPAADTNCRMRLESDHAAKPSVSTSCTILSTGIVSGSLPLASSQPPGDYRLLVQVGDSNSTLALRVTSAEATAELHVSEATGSLSIHASRSGRPLAGATISWTLDLEAPTVAEEPGGFHFDLAKQLPPESSGSGEADADGNLRVNLPLDTGGPAPLRYRLRAEVRAGERLLVSEQHAGQIAPSTPRVGLRLAARVVSTSERAVVEILTLVAPDRPAP
ncbi:MAG: alpha-2-macroglobulin, partial [Oscillochloris sp.]|nr:alpha-2-macroglobulin [Oscillochloris sp.]